MSLPTIVVLISGSGSNLQALINATQENRLKAKIVGVISNRKNAYGLERAKKAGITTHTFSLKQFKDSGKTRVDFDVHIAKFIQEQYHPDLVILAGWMHILSPQFLSYFNDNVMNLHPALPGKFDGAHAIERAFEAFKKGEIKSTGIMVHKVIADVDRGSVILQREIPIYEKDTLDALETRIHENEHLLIVEGAQLFLDSLSVLRNSINIPVSGKYLKQSEGTEKGKTTSQCHEDSDCNLSIITFTLNCTTGTGSDVDLYSASLY
ncbi:formyl transferase-domain-containing protein [Pilobolus umbonatus]|nr:formyl transferase-domain-containing protein [Pilobolus umbonatus]